VVGLATETDLERLRQMALLLEAENARLHRRLVELTRALAEAKGSSQISGDAELAGLVDQVIAENAKSVADFKAGKAQALKFLIGQAMKLSKGRANPQRLDALLREKIS